MHRLQLPSLSRIIDRSVNEVYVFDCRTLRFLYANNGARTNLGYSIDELEKITPVDLKPEFQEPEFRALLQPLIEGTDRQIRFETFHRRKDGSTYLVEVNVEMDEIEGGQVFIALIRDITDDVAVRKAKDALVEDLKSFNKFVSHDILAPIRQGLFFCEELEGRYPGDTDIERLKAVLARARGMVRAFSLLHSGTDDRRSLNYHRLETIIANARAAIDSERLGHLKDLVIVEDCLIFCDEPLLSQVFKNLIENAVKYRGAADPVIEISCERADNSITIFVRDNGMGIARENWTHIFGMQFREQRNESVEGNGLGLAICRRIMTYHQGDIHVHSSGPDGTVMAVVLPSR